MQRIHVHELPRHTASRVRLAGWLQHQRQLSRLTFLLLRDVTGVAQVVVDDATLVAEVARLLPETVLEIDGDVVAAEHAPGGVELHAPVLRVMAAPVEPPPIDLRRPTLREQLPTILDHAPIALRHPRRLALFQVGAASLAGFRRALDSLGFTEIQTPKLVGAKSESGTNVFSVDYFGREAYLAQSPQLYKQMLVGVFERVYETGPAFRAEPHDTGRHLSEYVSLDAELGFIEDHRTVMAVARDALAGMAAAVADRAVDLPGLEVPRCRRRSPQFTSPRRSG